MDSFLLLFCFLLTGVVTSNAALLPAEVYWHTVLPNTRMPTAFSDLLSSAAGVGKGGVYVQARNEKRGSFIVPLSDNIGWHNGQLASTAKQLHEQGSFIVPLSDNIGWHNGQLASTAKPLHDNLQVKVNPFFLEQDLHPGFKMTLQFDKTNDATKFLPRSVAESISFSSKQLPEIISRFSVQPGSDEENAMKTTLRSCEYPGVKGEIKMCPTSLESIVDFAVASLGTRNILAVSTTVHSKAEASRQEYTIAPSGVKNLAQDQLVACHQVSYPYAVFYCHLTESSTKGYTVRMTGKDGTVVDAVAVCHTDTSDWNPKHIAFQVLNVKPGTVPVCHFFPRENHVILGRSN